MCSLEIRMRDNVSVINEYLDEVYHVKVIDQVVESFFLLFIARLRYFLLYSYNGIIPYKCSKIASIMGGYHFEIYLHKTRLRPTHILHIS